MSIALQLSVPTSSRASVRLSGSLLASPALPAFHTCRVTGIWFGSAAAQPGALLSGLHGDLLVTREGHFRYEARPSTVSRMAAAGEHPVAEEVFSLNLSDSAGASCVTQLTVGIQAHGGVVGLDAQYRVLSTVTERYCLTRRHGLALLCMETGEHFVMCEVDTPLAAVARSHQREFFGIGGQHLLRIDPINGNTIWIGILDLPCHIRCLESAPDGMLYGVDSLGDLYRIQPSNGATMLLVKLSTPSMTRGAMAYHEGALYWTAADNRLHRYDLDEQAHDIVVDRLQPMAPDTLHDRVIAMMPSLDGGLFVATADGILRLNPGTGGWIDTRVRARLAGLVSPCSSDQNPWGGREPGQPLASEPAGTPVGFAPALLGH